MKRILIYSPYGHWYLHTLYEITIAHGLKLRGAEVKFVCCDGLYSDCDVFWENIKPRHEHSCENCMKINEKTFGMAGMPFEWLGKYLPYETEEEAKIWVDSLKDGELFDAAYHNYPLGEWVKSSVHSHFRMRELDVLDSKINKAYRSYLYSSVIALKGLNNLLENYRPDTLFLLNGRFFSHRIALELARERPIRVIVHERGRIDNSIILMENTTVHSMEPLRKTWHEWKDITLNKNQIEKIEKVFIAREKGKNTGWKPFVVESNDVSDIIERFQLSDNKKVITLFTSSEDECASSEGWEHIIDQFEWIRRTIDYFARRRDYQLVIRVHPNTSGIAGSEVQSVEKINEIISAGLPDNVKIVKWDEKISSYQLIELSQACLTYWSTVSLEASARGKPVMLCARGTLYGYPFALNLPDANEYEGYLDKLLAERFSIERMRTAYRFGYHHFIRWSITFPLVSVIKVHNAKLNYITTRQLLPGKDKSLDRICDFILLNKPVYPAPEPGDENSLAEENKFLEEKRLKIEKSYNEFKVKAKHPLHKTTVSVVIPCYNQAHYLPEAVESIVNQTYTNWQCIIVNDGSSDNTGEVAGELIKKYSNHDIRLIEKPNGGVADARNTGIDAAESDWVLLLDSDDMFERTFMQKAVNIIRREPKTDIVFANLQQFGADSGEWIPDEYSRETIPVKNTIPYASLYRKELWHKVGGYDRVLGKVLQLEDWTFWISCSQYNPVVRRIPEKLFLYRVHSSNIWYQLIKPNWRVAEALIVTAYPNLYSPPGVVRAWKLIANCPEQIYQRILRTIEMYPEYGLPYLWRGLRYQQQGRIDEAIRDYQAAVQKAGEDDWQCFVCLACLQERVGDMPGARDNIEKVLTIRGDFNWARDMLPDAARRSISTESQTGRQKILFYFDRIGNLNETSPAGTVIAILNFARALQSSNPDVEIHITGDLVRYPEQYESFRVIPLSPPEQREQFLVDYDVVFFATHIRYFKGLTKPSGQIWVLWQHCWEADDRVSLSHSSDFDIVICLSELHRASLRGQHIGDEKLITIPNLIDTDVYSPRHIRRNNHSIMFAGGLNPHKCINVLMDAFRLVRQQVEDAELHIYGDGQMWRGGNTYGNGLKSIKPEGAYFHGYVDNKDMPQIYSKHSILCLPSKLETLPMVVVEAQACGCIPVVHHVGGVAATVIDGETGILYSPNTPEKLAEIIIKAIKIVDADPSIRQKAIDFVRNTFSINRAAEYISKLWDRITVAKKVNTIRTLLEGNEIKQADFKCEKLLQKDPNHPDVQLLHALIMLRQGNEQKANLVIEELLENFPNHLRVLNDCGLMAMKAGDKEKALRYFIRAYKFNPWDKNTTTNCYAILKTSDKYRDAKMLLLNYLTNVGEDAQVLQLFREIDNLIANAGLGTNVVSQEVLDNRQSVYCRSSTSKPLVSIIMPVYNGADYIGQAIESVLSQEYPNFELVIIDDGSTDNTKEVILRYNDERIRYHYQENNGVSSARNRAIRQAKGQYIMPLDADDMITPDCIILHLQEFEKYPEADLIYCDVLLIDGNGNPIRVMNKPEYHNRRHLIRDLFRAGHPIVPFRLGIRRSVFDRIGFYDEHLAMPEDFDMIRRFVKAGLKEHHLRQTLHLRRMQPESLSRSMNINKARDHFEVMSRIAETFDYEELFPDIDWSKIPAERRRLHAKCLIAATYQEIGRRYIKSEQLIMSGVAFEKACSELNDCLKMDPENQGLRQLLQKSKLIRARYTEAPQQVVSK